MNIKEKYTISEATLLLGFKSRSTLNKRTKTVGQDSISYEKDEQGTKVIRLIELQRVFPDRVKEVLENKSNTPSTTVSHSAKIQSRTSQSTTTSILLQHKMETLETQLEQEKTERLRERREAQERDNKSDNREHLLQQQVSELTKTISQQTRLLEDHREPREKQITKQSSLVKEVCNVLKQFALAVILISMLIATISFLK